MNILILGNGFDLAHDLKTRYTDFLNYYIEKYNNTIPRIVKYGTTYIDNLWLRHFITTCNNYGKNWIDIEEEIYKVVLSLNKMMYNISGGEIKSISSTMFRLQKDILYFNFYEFIDHLKTYDCKIADDYKNYQILEMNDISNLYVYFNNYQGIINFIYDQLRDFTKLFEQYLNGIISEITSKPKYKIPLICGAESNITNPLFVLNFNYTDTLIKLYEQAINSREKLCIRTFHVHGKINSNNMVLGTQFFDNNKDKLPVEFNVFRKYNQRHKFCTIEEYQNLLQLVKSPNDNTKREFHIIGHSLDKSDYNILRHILLANKDSIINVYYHDEDTQEKLINNITEIIGEEEVMTKVRFINQEDSKRGILIPLQEKSLSTNNI